MATEREHLRQAEHNEDFVGTFDLTRTPYLDWAATVIFYAALHYIRALAARHRIRNISRYAEMDNLFDRLMVFRRNPGVYEDYRQLKDDSRAARYDMRRFSPEEVMGLRDEELRRINQFVRTQLAAT
ncbi:MAG: hypothetical protein O6929_01720 [candidate division NC10 bacterium]|nr:hypothetical protein [candidate division NC10 bacterium]